MHASSCGLEAPTKLGCLAGTSASWPLAAHSRGCAACPTLPLSVLSPHPPKRRKATGPCPAARRPQGQMRGTDAWLLHAQAAEDAACGRARGLHVRPQTCRLSLRAEGRGADDSMRVAILPACCAWLPALAAASAVRTSSALQPHSRQACLPASLHTSLLATQAVPPGAAADHSGAPRYEMASDLIRDVQASVDWLDHHFTYTREGPTPSKAAWPHAAVPSLAPARGPAWLLCLALQLLHRSRAPVQSSPALPGAPCCTGLRCSQPCLHLGMERAGTCHPTLRTLHPHTAHLAQRSRWTACAASSPTTRSTARSTSAGPPTAASMPRPASPGKRTQCHGVKPRAVPGSDNMARCPAGQGWSRASWRMSPPCMAF